MEKTQEINLKNYLQSKNFYVDDNILNVLYSYIVTTPRVGGVLLRGPPGVGKTTLVELLAQWLNANLIYFQATPGTSEDDLLYRFIPSEKTRSGVEITLGPVPRALQLSKRQKVVLLIDEFDKTRPSADALLLDVLQNFRISLYINNKKTVVKGNPNNLYVFLTSNDIREFSEPLLRRLLVVYMSPLRPNDVYRILIARGVDEATANLLAVIYVDTLNANLRKAATVQELFQCYQLLRNGVDLETALRIAVIKYDDDWQKFKAYLQNRRVEEVIRNVVVSRANDTRTGDALLKHYDFDEKKIEEEKTEEKKNEEEKIDEKKIIEKYALLKVRSTKKEAEPQTIESSATEEIEVALKIANRDFTAYTHIVKSFIDEVGDDPSRIGKFELVRLDVKPDESFIIAREPLSIEELMRLEDMPIEAYYETTLLLSWNDVKKLVEKASKIKYATKRMLALETKDACEEKMLLEIDRDIAKVKGFIKCDKTFHKVNARLLYEAIERSSLDKKLDIILARQEPLPPETFVPFRFCFNDVELAKQIDELAKRWNWRLDVRRAEEGYGRGICVRILPQEQKIICSVIYNYHHDVDLSSCEKALLSIMKR